VIQQVTTTADHLHQAQTGVQIFLMRIEVLNQRVDSVGPDGNLNFRRTGVTRGLAEFFN
jgi:hypothetical protein